MSYDLMVWEGEQPANDEQALSTYLAIMRQTRADGRTPPSARIRAYVEALVAPDFRADEEAAKAENIADILAGASGSSLYLTMSWHHAQARSAAAAELADAYGLNCFDPQTQRLRP